MSFERQLDTALSGLRRPLHGMVCRETERFLRSFASDTWVGRAQAIDKFILRLKRDGLWDKCRACWLPRIHGSDAAILNVRNPSSNPLLTNAGLAWARDIGIGGDGAGYAYTQVVPTDGTIFSHGRHSMAIYVNSAAASSAFVCGNSALCIRPNSAAGEFGIKDGASGSTFVTTGNRGAGLYGTNRRSDTEFQMWFNSTLARTVTQSVTAPSTSDIDVMRDFDGAPIFPGVVSFLWLGAGLSDVEYTNLATSVASLISDINASAL